MDIVEPKQKEASIAALAIKAASDSSNIASVQTCEVRRLRHLHGRADTSAEVTGEVEQDSVAVEMPVALVFNGISHAVMMLTPNDLEDFAYGFSLTEGIIDKAEQIYDCEVEANQHEGTVGVSIHITLASEKFAALKEKRRFMTGRTGCGLCGTESLTQAIRQPAPVTHAQSFSAAAVSKAVASMKTKQSLLEITGATHAAAFCNEEGDIMLLREDVGRHNALDKVIGALMRLQSKAAAAGKQTNVGAATAVNGFITVTSRASYEMVQKTACANIGLLAAVSGVTNLAIQVANNAGVCLLGFTRGRDAAIYTHQQRLTQ